jgi:uncharacterized membrane protein
MAMETNTDQEWKGRRFFLWTAWASPLAALVIAVVLWVWFANHQGKRGERQPAVLVFYLILLGASAAGALTGIVSLLGIRSWRSALYIVPGALLGIGINAFPSFYAHALDGVNLGG